MATLRERAAHLVNDIFSLLSPFVDLAVSQLSFNDRNLVLIEPVLGQFFPFTFLIEYKWVLLYFWYVHVHKNILNETVLCCI